MKPTRVGHFRNAVLMAAMTWIAGSRVLAQTSTNLAGLVSFWAADGHALDSTSTNHGTFQGQVGFRLGRVGEAFSFDGGGGYVQVTNSPSLQLLQESTLMAWINLDQLPSQAGQSMYIAGRSQNGNDFDLEVETDDRIRFYPCGGVGGGGYPGSITAVRAGLWYQVTATYKANARMELFVNAVKEVSIPIGCTLGGGNSGPFTIGLSPIWGRPFHGRIDQIRLFDRALSLEEIRALYEAEDGSLGTPILRIRVSQVELGWETQPEASYWLLYSSALVPGTWFPLSSNAIKGAGGFFYTNDVILPGQPMRSYRLVLTNETRPF
jgi:hypothetical protein